MSNKSSKITHPIFHFFVEKYRVSFLMLFILIIAGIFSLIQIPKESSPDIKFGIIAINTVYTGVNSLDIDELITDKIENEIENIEGIKKMSSSSSVGISSTVIELETGIDTTKVKNEIEDELAGLKLPEDAEEPSITEISSRNKLLFELLIFGDKNKFSNFELTEIAKNLKNNLEGKAGIAEIELGASDSFKWNNAQSNSDSYKIKVLLNKEKVETLGLNINQIASKLQNVSKNFPLGNKSINNLNYDFRIKNEISLEELLNFKIENKSGGFIYLKDISEIKFDYENDTIYRLGLYEKKGLNYVGLTFNKAPSANVFDVSDKAKELIKEEFGKKIYTGLDYKYTKDLSEIVIEDYTNLSETGMQTLFFVFLTILLFIGLKEGIIASILLPLSFFITFIVLNFLGLSLNFLTNFSLVLTLGIAIDTVIVIIEGASEKIDIGYDKESAILLAIRDLKNPLISGTATTLVAFLPMMFLPGVMGRFLSFIPITIFITLSAALFLSLTLNSTLFSKFMRNRKHYFKDPRREKQIINREFDKSLLLEERIGKKETRKEDGIRKRILHALENLYANLLEKNLKSLTRRVLWITTPIILLILSFVILAPKIGFTMFPATDNSVINITITDRIGVSEEKNSKHMDYLDNIITKHEELKVYYSSIKKNKINVYVELLEKGLRKKKGLKNVFDVEKEIKAELDYFESLGYKVEVQSLKEGPPTTKAVGIKLITNESEKFADIKNISGDFEKFLRDLKGTKNISNSSEDTPGSFEIVFNRDKIKLLGLNIQNISREIYTSLNGIKVANIKTKFDNNEVVIKYKDFENNINPINFKNIVINTTSGELKLSSIANITLKDSSSTILREKGKISVSVESDVKEGFLENNIQKELMDFAENYSYPDGISYIKSGEQEENKELIVSTMTSFVIALLLIFSILVLQFNSYSQPFIILYSIILALLGVNIGLFFTGNPYSMSFAIGFIALTGVVVNDAIIMIDKINKTLNNYKLGIMNYKGKGEEPHHNQGEQPHPSPLLSGEGVAAEASEVSHPNLPLSLREGVAAKFEGKGGNEANCHPELDSGSVKNKNSLLKNDDKKVLTLKDFELNSEGQAHFSSLIISASISRLQPVLVTTLTTICGILPLALHDEFWAGLGFTIIFGLTAGSFMTLFVVPIIYYSFMRKKLND